MQRRISIWVSRSSSNPRSPRKTIAMKASLDLISLCLCSNPRSPRKTIAISDLMSNGITQSSVPILDRPERRSQWCLLSTCTKIETIVPILDRPERRSQSFLACNTVQSTYVPILDRPERRSQYVSQRLSVASHGSNPRSPRKTIAIGKFVSARKQCKFQSSIAPKDDRNRVFAHP